MSLRRESGRPGTNFGSALSCLLEGPDSANQCIEMRAERLFGIQAGGSWLAQRRRSARSRPQPQSATVSASTSEITIYARSLLLHSSSCKYLCRVLQLCCMLCGGGSAIGGDLQMRWPSIRRRGAGWHGLRGVAPTLLFLRPHRRSNRGARLDGRSAGTVCAIWPYLNLL